MYLIKKAIPWVSLGIILTILLVINSQYPKVFSDQNKFFSDFLDSDLLSTVGFMASISLATATSIHFAMNDFEIREKMALTTTKASVRRSATSLIVTFVFALLIVVVKPLWPDCPKFVAYANMASIMLLIFNAFVMHDLLMTALSIPGFKKP
jgi:hypothetical protein